MTWQHEPRDIAGAYAAGSEQDPRYLDNDEPGPRRSDTEKAAAAARSDAIWAAAETELNQRRAA